MTSVFLSSLICTGFVWFFLFFLSKNVNYPIRLFNDVILFKVQGNLCLRLFLIQCVFLDVQVFLIIYFLFHFLYIKM